MLPGPLRQVVGPRVALIDPARYVAIEAYRRLRDADLLNPGRNVAFCHFVTTGPSRGLEQLVQRYLGTLKRPSFASASVA